jgi:hypothetical protein
MAMFCLVACPSPHCIFSLALYGMLIAKSTCNCISHVLDTVNLPGHEELSERLVCHAVGHLSSMQVLIPSWPYCTARFAGAGAKAGLNDLTAMRSAVQHPPSGFCGQTWKGSGDGGAPTISISGEQSS